MRHKLKPYLFVMSVSIVVCLLQLEYPQSYAIWQRQYIVDGEWWRVVSGHFTHTNHYHLLMNLAALWVMAFIFKPQPQSLAVVFTASSITIGLLNFLTPVQEYAGLSGVLHSVFAYFALNEALNGLKSSWLLVAGIVAKVSWEQLYGASASTAQLIQASVAVDAHMFGVVVGLLLAIGRLKIKD
ncbi:rhombosortase [Vibrio astriarenae]